VTVSWFITLCNSKLFSPKESRALERLGGPVDRTCMTSSHQTFVTHENTQMYEYVSIILHR